MPLDQTNVKLLDEFATDSAPGSRTSPSFGGSTSHEVTLLDEFAPSAAPAPTRSLADVVTPPSSDAVTTPMGDVAMPPAAVPPAPAPTPPEAPPAPTVTAPSPDAITTPMGDVGMPPVSANLPAPTPPPAPSSALADIVSQPTLADVPGASNFAPQSDPRMGILGAGALGFQQAMEEGRRMARGETFSGTPQPVPEMTPFGKFAYDLMHGSPTVAAGALGGAGGAAIGGTFGPMGATIGGIGGAALGAGAMSAAQALAPAYDNAIRNHMTHDQAVDYAIHTAQVSGMFGTLSGALFTLAPFRSAVSNALLHIFGTTPYTAATQSVAQSVATDQPLPSASDLASQAVQATLGAAAIHGATQATRSLLTPGPGQRGGIDLTQPVPRMLEGPPQDQAPPVGQLAAPTRQLPAPETPTAPGTEPGPGRTGDTPGPTPPTVPPQPAPAAQPDTQPAGGQGAAPTPAAPTPAPEAPQPVQPGSQGQEPSAGTPVAQGGGGAGASGQPTPAQPDTTRTPAEGAPGSTRVVETNNPSVSLPTEYRVVEANTLQPATGVLQPRDRAGRQASDVQVAENAARLDPFRLTGFPTAEHGAPVVMNDGTVLAGNGRLAAINRAADIHPERYEAYKQALSDLGHDITGFDRPVLVRQATGDVSPEDARKFAEASNVPAGMAMSPVEQAKVDGRNLSDTTLDKYDPSKPLTATTNQGFMRDWMQSLPAVERNRLVDAKGNLSAEGLRRVQGAVLAKAYEHDGLLGRALESPNDDVKSITGSLMDAAAPYVKLRSEVKQGRLPDALDITQNISEALDLVNQARAKGIAPGDILKQGDMFSGAKLNPVTEQIIRTFYNDQLTRLRSRPKMTEALRDYVQQALAFKPGKDLFGNEAEANPAEMLRAAREGNQGDLLAAESRAPLDQQIAEADAAVQRAIGYNKSPQAVQQLRDQADALKAKRDELAAATPTQAPAPTPAAETKPAEEAPVAKPAEEKPVARKAPVAEPDDIEEPADNEFDAIDRMSPDELLGDSGEEAAPEVDTSKARIPSEQPQLDQINKQLAAAERTLARARAANKGDTVKLENQVASLTRKRNEMLSTEARIRAGQFRPKPSRAPLMPHRKKPPQAPKDAADYFFRSSGKQVWQQAFTDAGEDPNLATSKPLDWQIRTLTAQTKRQFGLKDVTHDPAMDRKQLRDILLDTYRAATDGMASLGYPADALGLFGTISLHLKPFTPKIDNAGSYEFKTKTINIVGTANSLGHEWTHAVDHWLLDQLYPQGRTQAWPLASKEAAAAGGDPNDTMAQRFGRVLQTLFYDEAELAAKIAQLQTQAQGGGAAAQRAQAALDRLMTGAEDSGLQSSRFRRLSRAFEGNVGPQKEYYGTVYEMLARAHESYISRRMEDAGVDPRGFVMQEAGYLSDTVRGLNVIYPKDAERVAIYDAFDHLHHGLRNLLITGTPAGLFADKNANINLNKLERSLSARVPPGALRAIMRGFRESAASFANFRESLAMTTIFDETRPKSHYKWSQRLSRGVHEVFSSEIGQLEVIHAMVAPGARPAIQKIIDMLGTTPGSEKGPGYTFDERAINLARTWSNIFTNILRENSMTGRDAARMKRAGIPFNNMLRHALTTGESTYNGQPIPENIKKATGAITELMNDVFEENRNAGLNISYAKNGYFPRIYDHIAVWEDRDGFIADAKKLFKLMFDREVGDPGDNPEKLLDRWRQLSLVEREMAEKPLQEGMVELARVLRKLKAIPARITDIQRQIRQAALGQTNITPRKLEALHRKLATVTALARQLLQDAEDLARQWHNAAGNHVATLGANEWAHRINVGYPTDFDTIGPSGNYLNKRKLPPEADQIMEKWLQKDVPSVLMRYFMAASRKQAYIETFGANNEKFEELITQAYNGGAQGEDTRLIRDIQEFMTGRNSLRTPRALTKAANYVQAYAAWRLLGRSLISMIAEPMNAAAATGHLRTGLKTFAAEFGDIMKTANAQERGEIAEMIGVTTSALYDDIILNRSGEDYADSPRVGALMGRFYRGVGLTQFNNRTRRSSMAGNNWFLTKLSNDWIAYKNYQGPQKGVRWRRVDERGQVANGWLNELGVPEDLDTREAFAEWMVSRDGEPKFDEIQNTVWRPIYTLAMNRLVDRSVQNPKKGERGGGRLGVVGRMLLQFQSYLYGMSRNIATVMFKRIERRGHRALERARIEGRGPIGQRAAKYGAMIAQTLRETALGLSLLAASVPGAMLKTYIYNHPLWEKKVAEGNLSEYIFDYAMNQTGLGGPLTLPFEAISQVKFQGDLGGVFNGPGLHSLSQDVTDMLLAATGPRDPNTNTAAYNGAKAAYNMLAVPTMALGLSYVSGGFGPFATAGAGVGYSWLTSQGGEDWIISQITGAKGTVRPPPEKEGAELIAQIKEDIAKMKREALEEMSGGPPNPGVDNGFTSMVPWGLLDDVTLPVARGVMPYINKLPGAVKVGGAIVGIAAYGGLWFLPEMEPFRNAPPPPPK